MRCPPDAPELATARVGADEADAVPAGVTALTRTASAWPTSAAVGVYERAVAAVIAAQAWPAASQRVHWYENATGLPPPHVPGSAASTLPACGPPTIAGALVRVGDPPGRRGR